MGETRTRRIVVEVEVPEGAEWIRGVVEDFAERLAAYVLLEAKARGGGMSEEELMRVVEEARARVWERVKHAYTSS